MKYFFLVILFLCAFASISQVRFNNVYDFGRNEWQNNLIINSNGEYVGIGRSFNNGEFASNILAKYDMNGAVIDTDRIEISGLNLVVGWEGSIIEHSFNNNYFTTGIVQWYDTTIVGGVRSRVLMCQFLPSGDTVFARHWGDTDEYYWVNTIKEFDTNTLLVGGAVRHDIGVLSSNDFYLAKLDTSGNLVWEKRIQTPQNDFMLNFFISKNKQKIYTAGGRYVNPIDNYAKPHFKVLDSSGNLLFTKEWTEPAYSSGAIICDRQLVDSSRLDQFLVVSGIDTVIYYPSGGGDAFYNLAQVAGVDTNLNILWRKNLNRPFEVSAWYNAKALKNGRIIVVGGKLFASGGFDWEGWAVLLDDSGNTIWDRTYTKRQTAHYFSDVQECADGGFIFTGVVYDSPGFPTSDAWLVKVDSLGCEAPNCTPMSIPEEFYNSSSLLVYPNPANSQLNIELNNSKNSSANYYVYNAIGQFILEGELKLNQKSILDISNLAN
ncbi:MAG TPA: hypothetical protein PLU17_09895, partial [Chitinophagaceae bacterium]|nr:hypothetical protein [Chitinophagaceae bacterium]